jgi:hypothetical protein
MMDMSAFRELVETYGADRRRWPDDRRAAAEALLETDPAAQTLWAEEARFEETLGAWGVPEASDALREAIFNAAPRTRGSLIVSLPRGWFGAGIGAMMAASCAAGVMAGSLLVAPPEPTETGEAVVWAALSGPADASVADDEAEVG